DGRGSSRGRGGGVRVRGDRRDGADFSLGDAVRRVRVATAFFQDLRELYCDRVRGRGGDWGDVFAAEQGDIHAAGVIVGGIFATSPDGRGISLSALWRAAG